MDNYYILTIWEDHGYINNAAILWYHNRRYIVVDDNQPIYRLMDYFKNILVVAENKCTYIADRFEYISIGPLIDLGCVKRIERDYIAEEYIYPLVYNIP